MSESLPGCETTIPQACRCAVIGEGGVRLWWAFCALAAMRGWAPNWGLLDCNRRP